jgi:hypothetical protein
LIPYEVDFLNSEILKAYHLADQFGHIWLLSLRMS